MEIRTSKIGYGGADYSTLAAWEANWEDPVSGATDELIHVAVIDEGLPDRNLSDEYARFVTQVHLTRGNFRIEDADGRVLCSRINNELRVTRSTLDSDWVCVYEDREYNKKLSIIVPDFEELSKELMAYFAKHPEELQNIRWRKFEELLDSVFKNLGYETQLGPGSADGGVDLRLIQKDSIGTLLTLVQAKRYKGEPIKLQAVQALHGAVNDEKAHRGLFVTTSRYLPSAQRFADRQHDRLVLATSADVAKWCKTVTSS